MGNYVIRFILGFLGWKHVWNSCYLGCSSRHNFNTCKATMRWFEDWFFSTCCCWDQIKICQSLNRPYGCICSGIANQVKSTSLSKKPTTFILTGWQFYLWSLFKMEKLSPALKLLALEKLLWTRYRKLKKEQLKFFP